jgi:hypothetical protein
MPYTNPGELFIEKFGPPEGVDDVLRYAHFLREEAGLTIDPPIDLARIYARFAIPTPKRRALPTDIQGLLLSLERGIVVINDNDPVTRQRFSEAHELIEFLFNSLPPGEGWTSRQTGIFRQEPKERLCQVGAAELLMPRVSFLARVDYLDISFQTARQLAAEFNVSVTAALVQIALISPGRHAVVLWRMKNKPTEIRDKSPESQLSFFSDFSKGMPPQKLRVEWSLVNGPYIPPNKSISEDSLIYTAWRDRNFTVGEEWLDLAKIRGKFRYENQPFEVEGEWFVLSLLYLPNSDIEQYKGL